MNIPELYQIYLQHPKICTDSRQITPGCLFFALKGETFNGNAFAHQALESGASYVIIDEAGYATSSHTILVDDVLNTLQRMAQHHRKQLDIPILAVGGSNGKTTSKELLHAVLSSKFDTISTLGNLNNHIGVALSLLRIRSHHQIAVIEIGANHQHETMQLCKIAMPTMGVVTNNGKDHLEGFGSVEGVRKANAEMFEYLRERGGKVFVNADLPDLMADSSGMQRITYALHNTADYQSRSIKNNHFASVALPGGTMIESKLAGSFNAINLVLAAAVGSYFGIEESEIAHALESYTPKLNRSQVIAYKDATIVMDAYNANPSSMILAIKSFMQMPGDKKCVILADMLELGKYAKQEHKNIIELLSTLHLQRIILIGPLFGEHANLIPCRHFSDTASAVDWFKAEDFSGWLILLKGSRGFQLEKLLA
ncbi:MAG: UDP-N-acetylmuramoyl-tripeptide--D-alanyl-D-alanine ligase [Flavobacteriales bacterium]|nr:UDP-N-acetylmuramoyl-tripeptide--D-alanyl-D-alanine ligase [Flavobacteriales bacterium]